MTLSNTDRLYQMDWGQTVLGPIDNWPPEMRTVLDTIMASDFPICTAWGESNIQIYNDAYNPIFGDKHPQSFGAPVFDSWPEISEFLSESLGQIWSSGQPVAFRDMLLPLNKAGAPEECYFDFSYSAIKGRDGQILGLMSIAHETTPHAVQQRRNAILALRQANPPESGVLAFSQQLHDILEQNEMDCRAGAFFELSAENGVPAKCLWSIRAEDGLVARLRSKAVEYLNAGSGNIFDLSIDADCPQGLEGGLCVPFANGKGHLIAILTLVPDPLVPVERSLSQFARQISQHVHDVIQASELLSENVREAKLRMAEQSAMYKFLFDNIQDGVIYSAATGGADDEAFILAINKQACRMLGYTPEEAIGLERSQLFFSQDRKLADALRERSTDGYFWGSLVFRRKDGSPVPVELTSNLFEDPSKGRRAVTIFRDLGELKIKQDEGAQMLRSEAIASLAQSVAHDFNNMLTVILGSLDELSDPRTGGSLQQETLQSAKRAADHAAKLTNQLLSYSRREKIKPVPVEIWAFLEEIRPLLISALSDSASLRIDAGEDRLVCLTDTSVLTSAIINLLRNARHAITGSGLVTIRAEVVSPGDLSPSHDGYELEDERYLALYVRDNGPGVPENLRETIFNPAFTTKGVGDGTGLGLTIALSTLRQIGGDLRLARETEGGAEFQILLRLSDTDIDQSATPDLQGHDYCVLYVEDNDLVRENTVSMLKQIGTRPLVARNSREALEIAKENSAIDIVLTDLVLPGGMSGRALSKQVKHILPEVPVIITTGYYPEEPTGEPPETAYLRKPYTQDQLVEILAGALQRTRPS
ncbi:hypothetical protein GCM10011503_32520 [Henriciella pelagia]|uniref:histidine kinase n=3 Tax=Henriciella pelagia TaxID=1977912 RepID=A0ABQ1K1L3_9PROT|nr:ATP-binding protein [Henriciella pelagia]GGB81237.1 hypothetical protein GCM10011503_32520 [Henriciella pelagia]